MLGMTLRPRFSNEYLIKKKIHFDAKQAPVLHFQRCQAPAIHQWLPHIIRQMGFSGPVFLVYFLTVVI